VRLVVVRARVFAVATIVCVCGGGYCSQISEHCCEICALLVPRIRFALAANAAITALGRENALVVFVVLPCECLNKVCRRLDADGVVETRDTRCVHPQQVLGPGLTRDARVENKLKHKR
jgi:hypothetical protein